jgi:hypothetical protein
MGLLDSILSDFTGIPASPDVQNDVGQGLFFGLPPIEGGEVPEPAEAPAQGNWMQQAAAPAPSLAARQKENLELLNNPRAGGSTSRFYNRKLYRELQGSKNPEVAIQARLDSRFRGAPTGEGQGMGPAPGTRFSKESRPYGFTDKAQWDAQFGPRRESGETLPPPVTGGDWSEKFRNTRANDFGAGGKERPGQKFDPVSGKIQYEQPKSIADSAKETQSIIDGIMRMTGDISAFRPIL